MYHPGSHRLTDFLQVLADIAVLTKNSDQDQVRAIQSPVSRER